MRKVLASLCFASLVATGYALADEAKNLQVLPKDMPKAEIKKYMKKQASSLGVQCEHCHDTDDYSKDTEKKTEARAMMKMTIQINKDFFKGEKKVDCLTCHNGNKEPKKPT